MSGVNCNAPKDARLYAQAIIREAVNKAEM